MFARNGFPAVIVSDNGTQFCGTVFQKFLKEHGIRHIKSAPYHPQGNGVVERFHGTLNKLIAKIIESRGNWAEVVPMALYFIRCTPCEASDLSPFVLMHGWEPNTPLQLLYKSWVQQELGDIDLQEWVLKNTEKIDNLRDKAVD